MHHRHHCGHGHREDDRRHARHERDFDGRHDGPGRRERGFGGGRGQRIFEHGDLRFVVLGLIAERPRHGYEIIKAIEEQLGGAYSPSPGVIYPTLTMLEELGYASVADGPDGKRLYAISEAGTAYLADNEAATQSIRHRIEETRQRQGDGPPAPVLRAMENLKFALRLKLGGTVLSPDQVHAIAALIDQAAVAVERS